MLSTVILKENEEKRVRGGHFWIFSNEIAGVDGAVAPGDKVVIKNSVGRYVGVGFYNPDSLIACRLLSREPIEIDRKFFSRKIESALSYRKFVYPERDSYRLIFGESDGLPGLVVDKYGPYLVVQSLCLGMDKLLPEICEALKEVIPCEGIVEKSDSPWRELENLEERFGLISGQAPQTFIVEENGLKFTVNLSGGQKTGFYFDQSDNRKELAKYAQGKRVLDGCCYVGAFAISLASAGAVSVIGVDSSEDAVKLAQGNAKLNRVENKCQFIKADLLSFIQECGDEFDIIVLDPPSYARNRKHITGALRSYVKLNAMALGRLAPGGLLATASCSHYVSQGVYRDCLAEAARKAERYLKLLEWHSQAKDHPVLLAMPETEYLKFAVLKA